MYSNIRRSEESRVLDRRTWAGATTIVLAYETKGAGTLTTELLDFGLVFEGPPFFTYGVELAQGEILVDGDYPMVSAGIAEWVTKETSDEDFAEKQLKLLHTGAYVAINVQTNKSYRLVFRMSFEGIAFKNTQFLR
jgi:hypothetical protein